MNKITTLFLYFCLLHFCSACIADRHHNKLESYPENPHDTSLNSLTLLSIEHLKQRQYSSVFQPVKVLSTIETKNNYTDKFIEHSPPYFTGIISYKSDGLNIFSRIDIPDTPMPEKGFPLVIFVHGWIGLDKAASYDFSYNTKSDYAEIIHQFVQAGFVVLTPGLRGHGTINNKVADGTEFIKTWDNGSYISPLFYSIDILNLIAGLNSLTELKWDDNYPSMPTIDVNLKQINIMGHSQGGDVVLTIVAVAGEGSNLNLSINAASIWSGCFLPRFEQQKLYGPMGSTSQAFLAGDKTWTGSAIGKDNSINPNFIFPYPPHWIEIPDNSNGDWTWQKDIWSQPDVASALKIKLDQMYQTFNQQIGDIQDQSYKLTSDQSGKVVIHHAEQISQIVNKLDAFNYPQYLTEKLALHHSDRDYYSPSKWNTLLTKIVNKTGGNATDFTYYGNTHNLKASTNKWFSPKNTLPGFNLMMQRNIELFNQVDE